MNIQFIKINTTDTSIRGKIRRESIIYVECDATNGAFSTTLPDAGNANNVLFVVKKVDTTTNAVTVYPLTGQDIDGDATVTLGTENDSAVFISNTEDWKLFADNLNQFIDYQWDDLRIVPGSFDRPGVSDPTIVPYAVGGGAVNSYLWEFAKNNLASLTCQLPHGYAEGQSLYAHLHWTPGTRGNEENGNTVGWKLDVSWANVNGVFPAMSTLDLSDACDGTDHLHQVTPSVEMAGTGQRISSMIICNVYRTDTGADDTWAGTVSGQRPILLEIDFHYPINSAGSRSVFSK